MIRFLSLLGCLAVFTFPKAQSAEINRSTFTASGVDVNSALANARGSIPQGWKEDSAWTSPMLSCEDSGKNPVVINELDGTCVDDGVVLSVMATLTIRQE